MVRFIFTTIGPLEGEALGSRSSSKGAFGGSNGKFGEVCFGNNIRGAPPLSGVGHWD